jgi:hypothetical protein
MKLHHALEERKHNIQQDYSVLKQVIANSYGAMGPVGLSSTVVNGLNYRNGAKAN